MPTPERAYEEIARPYLNRAWRESKKKLWRDNPKRHCCLHEHYYERLASEASKDWTTKVVDTVKLCIQHFYASVLPRLEHVRPEDEIAVATPDQVDPESFAFERTKIYAIPDYVYRKGEQWHIHDWKSGKPSERHGDQLGLYALWAQVKHGIPVDWIDNAGFTHIVITGCVGMTGKK